MTATDGLTGATAAPVERTIVVYDVPSASFTASPSPSTAGAPVGFNGTASSDPDGAIVSYNWNFGDGSVGGGATPSHTFAAPGTYSVTLTVSDSGGQTASVTRSQTVNPSATASSSGSSGGASPLATSSAFGPLTATVDERTGAITFTGSLASAGTFSWVLTFQNGRFGVFASRNVRCGRGFIRLSGRCRPARIVFAKGSLTVRAAGAVSFTVRPTRSAMKALRRALKQRRGVPVVAVFTFQSAAGGVPVSHAQSLTVRLKKR